MSKVPQIAIHEVHFGSSEIIPSGEFFLCPKEELDFLHDAGACRDLTKEEKAARRPAKPAESGSEEKATPPPEKLSEKKAQRTGKEDVLG